MSIRTHYDNLNIPRDADAQTIRAAYRRLSKQYHPDLNPDPDAHRIMQLINRAYEILSDPEKRAEHDRWIREQEMPARVIDVGSITIVRTAPPPPRRRSSTIWMQALYAVLTLALCLQIFLLWQKYRDTQQTPAFDETIPTGSYTRPATAPNGNPWPQYSAYLNGYPQWHGHGRYSLDIDNALNSSDVMAELFFSGQTQALRTFFIVERNRMQLDNLDAGSYTLRYRQLDSGEEILRENIAVGKNQPKQTIYLQRSKPL